MYYTSNWFLLCVCVSVLPAMPPTDGDQVSPEKGNFFNFHVFHARLPAELVLFLIFRQRACQHADTIVFL